MGYLLLFIKSIFVGVGAIAPGLSGGALAMIFGIYERLVSAVSHLFTKLKENFVFLATVAAGVAVGVVFFASVQRFLLANYMQETMFVFAGLVLGTVPGLVKHGKNKMERQDLKSWTIHIAIFLITLGIGIWFAVLDGSEPKTETVQIAINLKNIVLLFFAGVVLAGSLVIPGISGTVLLMLLGFYGLFINTIADLKDIFLIFQSKEMFESVIRLLILLAPLGVGVGLGAIFYAKLMEYLLKYFYSFTYAAIIGFVIGSIYELVPIHRFQWNRTGVLSLILALIGLVVSYEFNRRYGEQ